MPVWPLLIATLVQVAPVFALGSEEPTHVSGELLKSLDSGSNSTARAIRFSADGITLAKAGESIGLEVWDVATGELVLDSNDANVPSHRVAITQDGKASYLPLVYKVQVWDRKAVKLTGHIGTQERGKDADELTGIALHRDEKTLALGVRKGEVQLWDTGTKKLRKRLPEVAARVQVEGPRPR